MPEETAHEPAWDPTHQRFRFADRCPYPDCAQPVAPTNAKSALAWCEACSRPYEVVATSPGSGGLDELQRRPGSLFCTHTGEELAGHSLLDWDEAGGGSGRCSSPDDPRGAVFGAPRATKRVTIAEAWSQTTLMNPVDPEDYVSSVSVVRGRVVAVTARGSVGVFDAESGDPIHDLEQPLTWPDGSTDPLDVAYSVLQPPVLRGGSMLLAAAHQALFRDLRSLLAGAGEPRPVTAVEPDAGSTFLGPPLGIDRQRDSLFCLLQGRAERRGISDARLRFFTRQGEEICRHDCQAIARPPVFDRQSGLLVWVQEQGVVSTLDVARIGADGAGGSSAAPPSKTIVVEPGTRPTFVAARDDNRGTQLWLWSAAEGQSVLWRCSLNELAAGDSWRWDRRELGRLGPLSGFAVGVGSRHRDNAAGQHLGVATTEQVVLLHRVAVDAGTHPVPAGSHDPPILCSAGLIARTPGKLVINNQGIGWSDDVLHRSVAVPGEYGRGQGIAMFGRRVYIGHGMGVRSYVMEVEAAR